MRTALVSALAAALVAGAAATAVAAGSGADGPTGCPLPLSKVSLLGVRAAPDSLGGACDALEDQPHTP